MSSENNIGDGSARDDSAHGDTAHDDNIDAKGIRWWPKSGGETSASLNISPDAEDYNMNHRYRGKCVIFNNKVFEPHTNLSCRRGTEEDAKNLRMRFRELDFDVDIHHDLGSSEILSILKKEAGEEHSESDCFVCCILTHGDMGILFGKDGKFAADKVFEPFRGDVCPSLAGKPKIFLIQACQGDRLDAGVKVKMTCSADSAAICKIPTYADFLIAYSTVPGFYSWRNTFQGSWFIQAFCTVIEKYSKDMDLLQMMTIVNRRVAYDFESHVINDPQMDMMKQVPSVTSTLTRKIYFPSKLAANTPSPTANSLLCGSCLFPRLQK